MDAFLIPGGFGTRQELHNGRLHDFIRSLPEKTLLTSVCTGSWIYGSMGLLDGKPPTARSPTGSKRPISARCRSIDWPKLRRRRASRAPAWLMPAGSSPPAASPPAWKSDSICFAAGFDEALIGDVARVMEYKAAYHLYKDDVEYAA